jgi:hypothetical protein
MSKQVTWTGDRFCLPLILLAYCLASPDPLLRGPLLLLHGKGREDDGSVHRGNIDMSVRTRHMVKAKEVKVVEA